MSAKVTKAEARKVLKALGEFYGESILRDGVDAPFVPEADYQWGSGSGHQEIVWESGEFDWPMEFSSWMDGRAEQFGLHGLLLEPYNGFVLGVYRW